MLSKHCLNFHPEPKLWIWGDFCFSGGIITSKHYFCHFIRWPRCLINDTLHLSRCLWKLLSLTFILEKLECNSSEVNSSVIIFYFRKTVEKERMAITFEPFGHLNSLRLMALSQSVMIHSDSLSDKQQRENELDAGSSFTEFERRRDALCACEV